MDRVDRLARVAFPDLPKVVRESLFKQGYKLGAELRSMSDSELIALVGVDDRRLAMIREKYPFVPEPDP